MFSSTYHHHHHDSSSSSISNNNNNNNIIINPPPFPNFPSSSYNPSPPPPNFLIHPQINDDFTNNNTCLVVDDDPLLSYLHNNNNNNVVPFLHPFPEEAISNLAMFQVHDATGYNINTTTTTNNYASNSSSYTNYLMTQKPAATIGKKDRHSKIHTSQGLRDRRVRLSSEIARKFFDLQDLLEFDKPSNTLEWLFTKSENAIKELARSKCTGEKEEEEEEAILDFSNNNKKSLTTTTQVVSDGFNKGRKLKWTQQSQRDQEAFKKESRERARARARERTCYKRVQDLVEDIMCPVAANANHQFIMSSPIQTSTTTHEPIDQDCGGRWYQQQQQQQLLQIQPQPYPPPPPPPPPPHPHLHQLDTETFSRDHQHHGFNVIEESIMIKRNMMSSSTQHHHQNLAIPNSNREPSFNNNNNIHDYPLFQPYSNPNWDPDGNFSNFCGIATMNLSTCYMNQW